MEKAPGCLKLDGMGGRQVVSGGVLAGREFAIGEGSGAELLECAATHGRQAGAAAVWKNAGGGHSNGCEYKSELFHSPLFAV
jgi:hypothetical protein